MGEFLESRALLEALGLQFVAVAVAFLVAWSIWRPTRGWTNRLIERAGVHFHAERIPVELHRLVFFAYAWLLLVVVERIAARVGGEVRLIGIAATLTALWIVLRASALLLRDALLARFVTTAAWVIAALEIVGLLAATEAALDSVALTVGSLRLSLLLLLKAVVVVAILLWAALALSALIATQLQRVSELSPSVRVLSGNLIKIALVSIALLIGLNTVGINLTAFAVFSGAVGVGLGFGLQRIVSNFVSGIILLLERSIKPGDVIEVGSTFGAITYLGARYSSVRGRDGKEYLIPNENLITNQVINWSYSNNLVRLEVAFGVAYASDLHKVRELAIAVAQATRRVLRTPAPLCHLTGFGDSAINLLLRFWIDDPANGLTNIKGDVLLGLWDAFHEHGIEFPFPQRDVHIRDLPPMGSWPPAARAKPAMPNEARDDSSTGNS